MDGVTTTEYSIVHADGGYYVEAGGQSRGWFRTRDRAADASRRMAWGETVGDDTPEPGERLTAAVAYRRLTEAGYPVAKPGAGWGDAYALWMGDGGLVDHPMSKRQTINAALKLGLV